MSVIDSFHNAISTLASRCLPALRRVCSGLLVLVLIAIPAPILAQSDTNPSGLPLPRFVTTRSEPVNVRVGPGTQYDVAWVYVKEGQPVEIIQEFDTWRKIRDVDGDEGWVHQNLLSGRRAGLVTPLVGNEQLAMRVQPSADGRVRAWLEPGFMVGIDSCEKKWCAIRASVSPEGARPKTYTGFIEQHFLWGTYPDEEFH